MRKGIGMQTVGIVSALLFVAASGWAQCVGDCDGDGSVLVNELVTGVNIALGEADVGTCEAFDGNQDGQVTVDELVKAVNAALEGCPAASPCGNGIVDSGEECDDGNIWGGDGCASNCTKERSATCELGPDAGALLQSTLFQIELPITGRQILSLGKPDAATGIVPVAIRAEDMIYDPIVVLGIGCACVRGAVFEDRFGPGNAARGVMGCGSDGLPEVDYAVSLDHNTNDVDPNCENGILEDGSEALPHEGVCNGRPVFEFVGGGPRGAAYLDAASSISVIAGSDCSRDCDIPDNGPDCIPCTDDDLNQAAPGFLPLTTGTATGEVIDANSFFGQKIAEGEQCVSKPCATTATGSILNCEAVADDPDEAVSGLVLVGALSTLHTAGVGDNVVTVKFPCR